MSEPRSGGAATQRRAIITVLGARSGTSAMAGTLGLLGCALPRNLMPANWANTKGYFEPQDIADLHNELLTSVGSSWDDWREFPSAWFGSFEAAAYRDKLALRFEENYGDAPLSVLKEPRICRILPLWNEVFQVLNAEPTFCFVDRSPLEVAASLRARDGSSMEQGLLYYIRNHLDAEYATRGQRRAFLSYDDLLADWRRTTADITAALGVAFPACVERQADVDTFLERDLRRHKSDFLQIEMTVVHDMAFAVHAAFTCLSINASNWGALTILDRLREEFAEWQQYYQCDDITTALQQHKGAAERAGMAWKQRCEEMTAAVTLAENAANAARAEAELTRSQCDFVCAALRRALARATAACQGRIAEIEARALEAERQAAEWEKRATEAEQQAAGWRERYYGLRVRLDTILRRFWILPASRLVPAAARRFVRLHLLGPPRQ